MFIHLYDHLYHHVSFSFSFSISALLPVPCLSTISSMPPSFSLPISVPLTNSAVCIHSLLVSSSLSLCLPSSVHVSIYACVCRSSVPRFVMFRCFCLVSTLTCLHFCILFTAIKYLYSCFPCVLCKNFYAML